MDLPAPAENAREQSEKYLRILDAYKCLERLTNNPDPNGTLALANAKLASARNGFESARKGFELAQKRFEAEKLRFEDAEKLELSAEAAKKTAVAQAEVKSEDVFERGEKLLHYLERCDREDLDVEGILAAHGPTAAEKASIWVEPTKVTWKWWSMGANQVSNVPCIFRHPNGTWLELACPFCHGNWSVKTSQHELGILDFLDFIHHLGYEHGAGGESIIRLNPPALLDRCGIRNVSAREVYHLKTGLLEIAAVIKVKEVRSFDVEPADDPIVDASPTKLQPLMVPIKRAASIKNSPRAAGGEDSMDVDGPQADQRRDLTLATSAKGVKSVFDGTGGDNKDWSKVAFEWGMKPENFIAAATSVVKHPNGRWFVLECPVCHGNSSRYKKMNRSDFYRGVGGFREHLVHGHGEIREDLGQLAAFIERCQVRELTMTEVEQLASGSPDAIVITQVLIKCDSRMRNKKKKLAKTQHHANEMNVATKRKAEADATGSDRGEDVDIGCGSVNDDPDAKKQKQKQLRTNADPASFAHIEAGESHTLEKTGIPHPAVTATGGSMSIPLRGPRVK
ncbi:hypothetical protein LTR56_009568 [Elasticomyces elasticus]|nr:hypothetical protein LTR56_009568 [Elasticomyces elasticus]KAK3657248.1 hypothetical protein LTR22_009422 [Elasticomyces elasticus]KAK4922205.1 hypothetical protein LTR49_010426 [Elasticomyces elasticus]KAK5760856.1 hypothetical protein LTS12_009032 [Elasticomyces elasticus]